MPNAPAAAGSWRAGYLQRLFRHAPADHDPVILRHQRIYILPTRRGYAFLATLGMTLLTSLNYSLSLGFVATFMLAGLVATALVHTFRNLSGIELRPLAAGETFAGAVMPFTLALAGGATPRYAVTLTARGCSQVTVDVLPDSALPVALELLTPRRGRIVLGRVTLSSEFPMGLWHAWAYVHFPLAGIAFPRRKSIRRHCRRASSARTTLPFPAAPTRISPDCARTSPAIRCSASPGSRWREAPAGTRSSSKAAAAAGASISSGMRCPLRYRRRRRSPVSPRGCSPPSARQGRSLCALPASRFQPGKDATTVAPR
jgi:hypothetical protein